MILSQLLAQQVVEQGIGSTFIGGIVSIVMTRNLGPILIGIILAGQLGAAVTSEIGSMKISEQVDALKAMGVDPFQYLIVPRLVASVIMTPMVATTAVLISIYLGFFPAHNMAQLSWNGYEYSIRTWMQMKFIREMIWKAAVFGFSIALVASYKGLAVREGAADLGKKVTEAVVTCIVFVLLADLLLSVYYFQ
jgi:phospholipid/cholesterol/gamma-HCH transport system permease protein